MNKCKTKKHQGCTTWLYDVLNPSLDMAAKECRAGRFTDGREGWLGSLGWRPTTELILRCLLRCLSGNFCRRRNFRPSRPSKSVMESYIDEKINRKCCDEYIGAWMNHGQKAVIHEKISTTKIMIIDVCMPPSLQFQEAAFEKIPSAYLSMSLYLQLCL